MANTWLVVTAGFAIFYLAVKLYCKLTTGWCKSYVCLVGKTAIITGANSGIGYYTALDFAKRGARVILACRNEERARQAKEKIIAATTNENIVIKLVDLCSFESVRAFAEDVKRTEERIDILVNNAGLTAEGVTADGISTAMQANYFSHFLLTLLLVPKLKSSAPSRIVNVSSALARLGKIDLDKITEPAGEIKLYADSKLAQIYFTKELARKLKESKVTVYSLHPGAVKTEFAKNVKFPFTLLIPILESWFYKTAEEGAQTQIHVSLAQDIENLTGEHFDDCHHVETYSSAKDEGISRLLWEKSERIVQLQRSEML